MDEHFAGGVFSEELNGGRAGAEIALTPSSVVAVVPDTARFEVPYRECQIEMGGFNGRMIFCRDAAQTLTIFCDDRKFPQALALHSSGMLDDQLGIALKLKRSNSRRGLMVSTVCVVGLLLLIVGGYFGVRYGAVAAVHSLPMSIDEKLGKAAFESMDLGGPEVKDPLVLGAVQKMVKRLEPHSAIEGITFDVHVVQSPEMNAFCLPGGVIVVYTGLIEGAENPGQVAAVIGHEMAHATLRHGLERSSQSLGIWAAVSLLIGDAGGLVAAGADLFQIAAVNSYSRGQEDAADAEGVRMLHAAKIDPAEMARFFEILEDKHGDLPGLFAWISTHPQHADRIESVNQMVSELPKTDYQSIDVDWNQVKSK